MKPIYLIILSDCKKHIPVEEPTPFYNVYDGRMYGTALNAVNSCKLHQTVETRFITVSAVYGLLWGEKKIENYRKRLSVAMAEKLRPKVCSDFVEMWDELRVENRVEKIFCSLSTQHHLALPMKWIVSVVGDDIEIVVGSGGIGSRQGQLKAFLCGVEAASKVPGKGVVDGGDAPFVFKGMNFSMTTEKAKEIILEEYDRDPRGSLPTTWYCIVGEHKISCKYAMSCIVGREFALSHFTTQRAVQVLRKVGIECFRIDL